MLNSSASTCLLPAGASVTSIGEDQPGSPLVVLGLSNGQALVFRHTYKVTYPDGKKTITPAIEYPYGEAPIVLDERGPRAGARRPQRQLIARW